MITDEEWKKLKVGDVIWYANQLLLRPKKLIITKITEIFVYCDEKRFDEDYGPFLHLNLNDATQVVNSNLKEYIKMIQHQIDENLKELELEQENDS